MVVSEKKVKLSNSREGAILIRGILSKSDELDQRKEHFWAILLNGRNVSQQVHLISVGCLTSSIVHPREVFRPAVHASAGAVILAHNHPSGDPTPSDEDRRLTERLVEAGRILGIKVLDHIIVADGGHVSLFDSGSVGGERKMSVLN